MRTRTTSIPGEQRQRIGRFCRFPFFLNGRASREALSAEGRELIADSSIATRQVKFEKSIRNQFAVNLWQFFGCGLGNIVDSRNPTVKVGDLFPALDLSLIIQVQNSHPLGIATQLFEFVFVHAGGIDRRPSSKSVRPDWYG